MKENDFELTPETRKFHQLIEDNAFFEVIGWEGKGNKRENFVIGYNIYNDADEITNTIVLMNKTAKTPTLLYYPTMASAQKTCDILNDLLED